jgi:hypothetical protein
MNIQTGFDPDSSCMTIAVETNLLIKYYTNLEGMFLATKNKPEGLTVTQRNRNTAIVAFPVPKSQIQVQKEMQRAMVGIDKRVMYDVMNVISKFVNSAIRKEFKTTEFIPLYGYSKDDLHKDIQEAVKNKRKLCIIRDYSEYLAMSQGKNGATYIFHQYMVEYGTPEYTEASILLYNKDMKSLRDMFESKLALENWC